MLTLESVRKAYGTTVAVDGLSLTVRRGEVLGLLGPNGAGKSTTVNLAVGLLAPDTGRVVIDGAAIRDARRACAARRRAAGAGALRHAVRRREPPVLRRDVRPVRRRAPQSRRRGAWSSSA